MGTFFKGLLVIGGVIALVVFSFNVLSGRKTGEAAVEGVASGMGCAVGILQMALPVFLILIVIGLVMKVGSCVG